MVINMKNYTFIFDIKNEFHLKQLKEAAKNNYIDYHTLEAYNKICEIKTAMKYNKCIFWNEKDGTFTNTNFRELTSFSNDIYFPRIIVNDYKSIYNDMEKYGLECIVKPQERYVLENWMNVVPKSLIGRVVDKIRITDDVIKYLQALPTQKKFVKSLNRDDDYHFTGSISSFWNELEKLRTYLPPTTDLLISEFIEINDERRCVFIDGILKTYIMSNRLRKFIEDKIKPLLGIYLPKNIVIDIIEYGDEFFILECNCLTCSDIHHSFIDELLKIKEPKAWTRI